MKNRQIWQAVFLVCVFLWSCDTSVRSNASSESTNLDGIDRIPEWLMLQVENALPSGGLNVWIPTGDFQTSSLKRVPRFPNSDSDIKTLSSGDQLDLESVRNEQVSAQLAIASTDTLTNLHVTSGDLQSQDRSVIKAQNMKVRFVKYVPVHKAYKGIDYDQIAVEGVSGFRGPDVVGDPLIDLPQVDVPKLRTQPIWFTFRVPEQSRSGTYEGEIEIHSDQYETFKLNVSINVEDYSIPDPQNYVFNTDIWLNPFSIADFYNLERWSDEHWEMLGRYFDNLASWGQTKITTTIVHKPWKKSWVDGKMRSQTEIGYDSMIEWQLLPDGQWEFDYTIFDQYVEAALKHNNGPFISAHSMLVFRGDQRITYFDKKAQEKVEETVTVDDEKFKEVWSIFLKDFRDHLVEKGWFDQIQLAFDERPKELMDRVKAVIRGSVPEFEDKIYMSGHQLADVADLNLGYSFIHEHRDSVEFLNKLEERENPTRFALTCCSGAHPNRFSFSPAIESRQIPWISLKFNLDGYADWAYNSWPKDVFNYTAFNYPQGDEYFVYPGKNGPMSSIRWELIKEGIEDYELVKRLEERGISEETVARAIEAATKNYDSPQKDISGIIKAKQILLDSENQNSR